ncbi:MAG: HD-GYP domain-containing protein, partial [Spirochaetes bacterium]
VPIKQKDIDRLKRWNIGEVQSDGQVIDEAAEKDQKLKQFDEILAPPLDKELNELYLSSIEKMDTIYQNIKKGVKVKTDEIDDIINQLLPLIKDKQDEIISQIVSTIYERSQYAISAVNCMILSSMVAMKLKIPSHRLFHLSIAALLHDIGMIKVPEKILNKKEALSEEERKVIKTHPIYTYRIIIKTLMYPEEVGQIALQHHERWDGKGYPKGLSGKNIKLAARILSVADAFEAMISIRPYRNSMIGYRAMRELLNDNSRRFDSDILKIFIRIIGIYPIGSIVLLNNSSIGRVTATHIGAPLRPVVKIIIDSRGKPLLEKEKEVDLLQERKYFITRALSPEELKKSKVG